MRLFLCALLLALAPSAGHAQDRMESYAALHAQDVRLAVIAERILEANLPLCRNTMPLTGMILHSQDQYRDPIPDWFDGGPLAVSSIIPGAAADLAGFQSSDAILAINGTPIADLEITDEQPLRDFAFAALAADENSGTLALSIKREGQTLDLPLEANQGCRVLVEVLADNDEIARSDGRVLQISYGMAIKLSDKQLAAVFAHELAHAVLEHRRRLTEAGVATGFFGEFGRNRRLQRIVEEEADLLSVHLLHNAGFDPQIAPGFWHSEEGRSFDSGIFRSGRYASPNERAEMMSEEIAGFLKGHAEVSLASHLTQKRDMPFPD